MPALSQQVCRIDEVERLIDECDGHAPRYELVNGELLVTPAPSARHQAITGELYVVIREYVKRHRLGRAIFSPSTVNLWYGSLSRPCRHSSWT